jgi:retinol dehydrogenase-12
LINPDWVSTAILFSDTRGGRIMEHILDLMGKTVVLTGATSGIGLAAAKALVTRGAWVIGVGRSTARCEEAQSAVLSSCPTARITYLLADLSSQRQIHRLAADIRRTVNAQGDDKLDVLINNAGTVSNWCTLTEDGYELQFAVNYLAGFLLTLELLPMLHNAPAARVIMVSSGSHRHTRMHWRDVMYCRHYNTLAAYKQSKMANVLFAQELNRRLEPTSRIRAYAVDPGLVNTEIGLKGTSGVVRWVWERRRAGGVSPEEGAAALVFLAADASVEGSTALYWKNCRTARPSRYALRADEASRLWALSERLCGIDARRDAHVAT